MLFRSQRLPSLSSALIETELKVAMDMFDYPTAATIILMIFGLVVLVEQAGSRSRERVVGGH